MQYLPLYASGSTVLDKGSNETEDAGRRLSQTKLYLSIYQFYSYRRPRAMPFSRAIPHQPSHVASLSPRKRILERLDLAFKRLS